MMLCVQQTKPAKLVAVFLNDLLLNCRDLSGLVVHDPVPAPWPSAELGSTILLPDGAQRAGSGLVWSLG